MKLLTLMDLNLMLIGADGAIKKGAGMIYSLVSPGKLSQGRRNGKSGEAEG